MQLIICIFVGSPTIKIYIINIIFSKISFTLVSQA